MEDPTFETHGVGGLRLNRRGFLIKAGVAGTALAGAALLGPTAVFAAVSDDDLIRQAKAAAKGRPQPESYSSCLVYAQARGGAPRAYGNLGAFNLLFVGNDAKVNTKTNQPTAKRKSLREMRTVSNFTQALRAGDFIVWDRGAGGANGTYGHIAYVELAQSDRIVISQAGWAPNWRVFRAGSFAAGIWAFPKGS